MSALPSDIARFTSDGVLLTNTLQSVKDKHAGARDMGSSEISLFFDSPAHGEWVMEERFALLSMTPRVHDGIQVADDFGIGGSIPVFPSVPNLNIRDEQRGMLARVAIRAYSFDHNTDSFALEVTGTTG